MKNLAQQILDSNFEERRRILSTKNKAELQKLAKQLGIPITGHAVLLHDRILHHKLYKA